MAISEAVEDAVKRDDTHYSLGSVLNHVLLHQTVIGEESIQQMEMAGEEPDVIIACAGGGSNFAGIAFPWLGRTFRGGRKYQVIAVEPHAAPSLTRGKYMYDYGDTAKLAPMVKMYTLGHDFVPEPIHAGGLRYHGMSPQVSLLKHQGFIEARSVHQVPCFEAGVQFARTEGIIPAPESTHAIRVAIDEALEAKKSGEKKVILFNLSGHGYFDLYLVSAVPERPARGLRVPGQGDPRSPRPRRLTRVRAQDRSRASGAAPVIQDRFPVTGQPTAGGGDSDRQEKGCREAGSGSLRGERSDPPTRSLARVIVTSPLLANVNIMATRCIGGIVYPTYSTGTRSEPRNRSPARWPQSPRDDVASNHATTRVLRLRPDRLGDGPAGRALRRGAALPALRRDAARRSASVGPARLCQA